ncbi:MAG: hypothetical protein ACFCBU_10140, partial [Cyanophyceae cyanobacterium]
PDTRITVTLSPFAHSRITRLADAMQSTPATQAGRPIEDWVISADFEKLLEEATKDDAQRKKE